MALNAARAASRVHAPAQRRPPLPTLARHPLAPQTTGYEFADSYAAGGPVVIKVGEGEALAAFDDALLGEGGVPPLRAGGVRRDRRSASMCVSLSSEINVSAQFCAVCVATCM